MEDGVKVDHGRISGRKKFVRDNPWSNGGAHNFMSRSSNKRFVSVLFFIIIINFHIVFHFQLFA